MKDRINEFIPKLSTGVELVAYNDNEYVVSNAPLKHYIKVNRETYKIIKLIDGKKNIKEISEQFNTENNHNIKNQEVYFLLYSKLAEYGLIVGQEDKVKLSKKPSYLKLSFIILNEKIVSKIVTFFYFLFDKKIATILIPICIAFMSILLITNFNVYKNFSFQISFYYFLLVMSFSIFFHEIGHATSANLYGAKHGGIGAGFYLFTPVFYADVTDIWRLKKWERIIVNLSGVYFDLIFCSILSLLSLILDNYTLLVVSIVTCIASLFSLNPFLRSDGYWVLSDLMEKPNLLPHSFKAVRNIILSFIDKRYKVIKLDIFILLYGLISYGLIVIFLYYILIKNPNSLITFPNKLIELITNLFSGHRDISIVEYGELVVPFFFYVLLFRLLLFAYKKIELS